MVSNKPIVGIAMLWWHNTKAWLTTVTLAVAPALPGIDLSSPPVSAAEHLTNQTTNITLQILLLVLSSYATMMQRSATVT